VAAHSEEVEALAQRRHGQVDIQAVMVVMVYSLVLLVPQFIMQVEEAKAEPPTILFRRAQEVQVEVAQVARLDPVDRMVKMEESTLAAVAVA
jgi:hypothetical protein